MKTAGWPLMGGRGKKIQKIKKIKKMKEKSEFWFRPTGTYLPGRYLPDTEVPTYKTTFISYWRQYMVARNRYRIATVMNMVPKGPCIPTYTTKFNLILYLPAMRARMAAPAC